MKRLQKVIAVSLSVLLSVGTTMPVFADAMDSTTTKEEVVYIVTGPDGTVENINVVNIFPGGSVTDYGNYTAVKMMTTNDPITQDGDKITFSSRDNRVYYQGTMDGNTQIPWNINIRYELNGTEIAPEELAGKSGSLTIKFSITENAACNEFFYDNYALQAAILLDTEKCKNIKAEGATQANVGVKKQLSYTVLPGKGLDAVITADVEDFELESIAINGVKLSLDVDVENETLQEKVTELMDASKQLNDGAQELNDGAQTLKEGSGSIKDATSAFESGVGSLDTGIAELQIGLITVQDALSTLNHQSAELKNGSSEILGALNTIQAALTEATVTTDNLQLLVNSSGAIKSGIDQLCIGAAQIQTNLSWSQYKSLMATNGLDIDTLKAGNQQAITDCLAQMEALQTALSQIQNVPGYEEQAAQLSNQIAGLQTTVTLLSANNACIDGTEMYLNTMNLAVNDLYSGILELQKNYQEFDAAILELVNSLGEMTIKLAELSDGINQLVSHYSTLDSGINAYTDGVAAIVAGYEQIINGVSGLASGSKELLNGAGALTQGANSLYDGVIEICSGTQELSNGTNELYTQTDGMDAKIEEEIDEILKSIGAEDSESYSFVSDKNTSVESVQFVIKTEAIEKDKEKEVVEPEVSLTVWQKFLSLFGLY